MKKSEEKIYLLKFEVKSTSIAGALRAKSRRLYEVQEAAQEYQPEKKPKKTIGFVK